MGEHLVIAKTSVPANAKGSVLFPDLDIENCNLSRSFSCSGHLTDGSESSWLSTDSDFESLQSSEISSAIDGSSLNSKHLQFPERELGTPCSVLEKPFSSVSSESSASSCICDDPSQPKTCDINMSSFRFSLCDIDDLIHGQLSDKEVLDSGESDYWSVSSCSHCSDSTHSTNFEEANLMRLSEYSEEPLYWPREDSNSYFSVELDTSIFSNWPCGHMISIIHGVGHRQTKQEAQKKKIQEARRQREKIGSESNARLRRNGIQDARSSIPISSTAPGYKIIRQKNGAPISRNVKSSEPARSPEAISLKKGGRSAEQSPTARESKVRNSKNGAWSSQSSETISLMFRDSKAKNLKNGVHKATSTGQRSSTRESKTRSPKSGARNAAISSPSRFSGRPGVSPAKSVSRFPS